MRAEKGITLVALVITIIVLLILAMVTISIVMRDGIINHANNAVTAYNEAQTNEAAYLDYAEGQMNTYAAGVTGGQQSTTNP